MRSLLDDGTSLFTIPSIGNLQEYQPTAVSPISSELEDIFSENATFTDDHHREAHLLEPLFPHGSFNYCNQGVLTTATTEPTTSNTCLSTNSNTSTTCTSPTTNRLYIDLDCPAVVEKKVFDPDNMETRSSSNNTHRMSCDSISSPNSSSHGEWQPRPLYSTSGHFTRGKTLPYSTRSSVDSSGWKHAPPDRWTVEQVMDWLYSVASQYNIDSDIRGEAFKGTDGATLCQMKLHDFNVLGEEYASIIFEEFCKVQQNYGSQAVVMTSGDDYRYCQDPWYNAALPNTADYSPHHLNHTPNSTSAADRYFPKFVIKTENPPPPPPPAPPQKRGRGRPRKHPKPDPMVPKQPKQRGRKPGQRSKGHHLWEFLRDLVLDTNQSHLIRWEDHRNGVFRIVDSKTVSELWGARKKNKSMTYEKLSRAIRFCQNESVGYFSRLPDTASYPRRLCFKFGPKTWGWQPN